MLPAVYKAMGIFNGTEKYAVAGCWEYPYVECHEVEGASNATARCC